MELHGDVMASGMVKYKERLPVFCFFIKQSNDLTRKATFYKSSKWEYEEEFRLVFGTKGIKNLPQEAAKEVVLGCRAPIQLRNYVRAGLNVSQIKYF